ncbi:polysaccharide biosynthesis tyrosine autokinase [Novosphingobium sp. ST904]|uniref:GumC family protein n=1 Tax=Novosphingobium sp. ST904 TaxID=1684385 RepID=UPI0006C83FD7|nr:polysaccharide biosynthesis tyrosine autokinase [Novosphingobium sp. ST904]KPH65757.1 hypothetical protein ADT71_10310 [Novosphingobium sp. ST904]TCM37333.1 capsular exopolysaccharide synthesis family protein [Novosphingobium sp. ST904]
MSAAFEKLPVSNLRGVDAAPSTTSGPDGSKLIDLSWLAMLAWRHKWAMLAVIGCALAATLAAYMLAVKQYDANVVLALDRNDQQLVRTAQTDKDTAVDSPTVDTEVQVLLSPEVATAAVRNARLNTNPAFIAAGAPDIAGPLSIPAATAIVRSNLTVGRQGLSYAINLGYKSRDPAVAASVANAVADAYVSGNVQSEQSARSQDINMLRTRLDQLRGDVIKAEAAVAAYRAKSDLVSVSNDSTIAQQELSTLNTELASAKAELAASQGRASANAGENGTAVNSSPVIRDLRTDVSRLEVKLAEQSSVYGPNHPDRVKTQAQLTTARQALSREVSRASSGVRSDISVDSQRVGAIQSAIGSAKGRLLAGNNASVRLNELERVAESSRQLYQTFLDRYRVELATRGTEKSKAQVIARAQVPVRPSSPDLLVYMLGGLIAGIIAAVLLAMALEWRERGLRTRAETEEFTGYEVVSSLPDIGTMDEPDFRRNDALGVPDFVVEHRESPFSESVRAIWTALKIGHKGQLARSVGVTSSIPGEGKTSTAIALARSTALAGRRTLLVDCDMRRMGTTLALGLRNRPGLVEVLNGQARIEDVIVLDEASGAHVLPLNTELTAQSDIMHSQATAAMFDRFRQEYDFVVLDIAPAIPVAEARAIATMADLTLMVVRWRTTQRKVVKTAIRELDRAGARIFGIILTQVDTRSSAVLSEEMAYYQYYYSRESRPN